MTFRDLGNCGYTKTEAWIIGIILICLLDHEYRYTIISTPEALAPVLELVDK